MIALTLKLTSAGKRKFNASMHRKQLKLLQIQIWCVYLKILKFWMLEQELEQSETSSNKKASLTFLGLMHQLSS